jgi:hypothetical protein
VPQKPAVGQPPLQAAAVYAVEDVGKAMPDVGALPSNVNVVEVGTSTFPPLSVARTRIR